MKIRLLTLVGLAISFALPSIAQDKSAVDPEVRQEIEAVYMKFADAHNKDDAAAIAALYTQDAVRILSWESEGGLTSGQQAIEKWFAAQFASSPGEFGGKLRCIQSAARYPLSRNGVGNMVTRATIQ